VPAPHPNSVLVVGAGAAGIAVAEGLRRNGFGGAITIVGEEAEAPYDRPPLSKQVLSGLWGVDRIQLLTEKRRQDLAADWRLGRRAVSLEPDRGVALLDDGSAVTYDALAIASGVRPRTLSADGIDGVHVLRTRKDASDLGRVLRRGCRLVVVGGGFLGLEVAASARQLGASVTVVEQQREPLSDQLGRAVASRLVALHRAQGVDVRTGLTVARFHGQASTSAPDRLKLDRVELSDGHVVEADAALVAIGSVPCVEWLEGTSVRLGDGVICDEYCRAAPGIWAAGDVAHWHHVGLGRGVRLEHRMNATEQGRAVAANILGANRRFVPIPYFWTDHYHVKVQSCGQVQTDASVEAEEIECDGDSFVVEYRTRRDRTLVGALGWNAARHFAPYRRDVEAASATSRPL
jgi:3-phenylpropionate/trans-cinnamate dioxygenase ferredoxin reductase component